MCLAILGILRFVVDPSASAQESPAVIEPVGGGEFEFQPQDEITDAERAAIKAQIAESIEKLTREGRLEAASPQAVPLSWPVRKRPGLADPGVDGISNFVDQNLAF